MSRDPFELFGEAAVELVTGTFRVGMWVFGLGPQQRARRRAAARAAADERASREQQRKWHEEVEQQKARGHAGFATEEEARAALRGKGGRTSKLDERKFY